MWCHQEKNTVQSLCRSPNSCKDNLSSISHMLVVAGFVVKHAMWYVPCLTIDHSLVWFCILKCFVLWQRLWPRTWCAGVSEITQLTCAFHPCIHSFSPSPSRNSGVLTKQTVFLHWIYPHSELLPDASAKSLPHEFANEEKNQNRALVLSLNIFSRVWKANSTYLTLDVGKKSVSISSSYRSLLC